jgi:hypothetical protein
MGGLNCYTRCTSPQHSSTSRTRPPARCSSHPAWDQDLGPGDGARIGTRSESSLSTEGRMVCRTRVLSPDASFGSTWYALRRIVIFSLRNCKRATAECDRRVDSADSFGWVSRLAHSEFEIFTTHEETVREDVVSWVRLRQTKRTSQRTRKKHPRRGMGFCRSGRPLAPRVLKVCSLRRNPPFNCASQLELGGARTGVGCVRVVFQ